MQYANNKMIISIFLGLYDLKWKFWERMDDGQEKEIGCFLFTIKII